MKKKLTYRDKLLELSRIYNVKEVHEYIKRRKNLTSGQLELILRKNKIIIPKDFQTNFYKENISKPLFRFSKQIENYKDESTRSINKFQRKISNIKDGSLNSINNFFSNSWKFTGNAGLGFLNIFPKLWHSIYNFIGNVLTDLFNGIYNQKINANKANNAIIGFFVIVGIVTIVISGITAFNKPNDSKIVQKQIVKPDVKTPKIKPQVEKKNRTKNSKTR